MLALSRLQSIGRLTVLSLAAALTSSVWAQTPPAQTAEDEIVSIDQLQVEGTRPLEMTGELRDMAGYDDVYERNLSTAYIGKEMVERFKGSSPADVLKGLLNVHSSDARNSGALDPNIRGIQGPGRVPVTIDGTEQALTAYRGYNGVSNRSHIDPNLIGGIQVFKGPSLERDVPASVGGAVVIKTLDADDILREGQNFAMELHVEGSNNSIAPKLPTLLTGRYLDDVRKEIPGWKHDNDITLYINPHTSRDNNVLSVKNDYAYRVAAAGRLADVSLMAAYAYRDKGNHFSGKHNAGFYSDTAQKYKYDQTHTLAHIYRPGDEVPNTSSEMESWLFKATWKPTQYQQLTVGYRTTQNRYGEIMPSRLNRQSAQEFGAPQWPLSQVDINAYNLNYRWIAANPWLDLRINLWRTDSVTDGYNSGGYPNYVPPKEKNPIISNTSIMNALNDRNGVSLSNRMQLSNNLKLTVAGNFQHEKLGSKDKISLTQTELELFRRKGRREEYDLNFNMEWQPLERLTLTGGARYSSYWAIDDLLADRVKAGPQFISKEAGRTITYYTQEVYSEELIRKIFPNATEARIQTYLKAFAKYINEKRLYTLSNTIILYTDANGRYHRGDNPCTNGVLDNIPNRSTNTTGVWCANQRYTEKTIITSVKKRREHNWVPTFSAAYQLSNNAQLYVRHAQAIRYPSIFESTIGFSANLSDLGIKPEHTYSNEIAYTYSFNNPLSSDKHANVKIAYFHNLTKNVIERGREFNFWNIEQQTLRGVELQGRFDNGSLFTNLGITWNIENEVCDEHSAVTSDWENSSIPDCVRGGFVGGYLLSMVIPKFSANSLIGARFFNRKLEIGIRAIHHKKHENPDFEYYMEEGLSMFNNIPLEWGNITIFDMYFNWQFSDRFVAELTGTNLGNIYYVDPITRSAFPAPGRTLKLGLTYRF